MDIEKGCLESGCGFSGFIDTVKSCLDACRIRIIERDGFVPAAVFILFMNRDNRPHVLLTKRTDKVKTHKGQISFPGGAIDDLDSDILDTAYRETFEEVGISRERITCLGRFDDYVSIAHFNVSTFVGYVDYPVEYQVNDFEIEEVVEAPFDIFLEERYDKIGFNYFEGHSYKVYYYNFNSHVIWGMTAHILTDLARRIRQG